MFLSSNPHVSLPPIPSRATTFSGFLHGWSSVAWLRRQRSTWRSTYCPLSFFPTTRRVSHLGIGGRRRGGKKRERRSKRWKKRRSSPFLSGSSLSRSKGEGGKDGRRGDPRLSYPILLDSASKVSLSQFGLLL